MYAIFRFKLTNVHIFHFTLSSFPSLQGNNLGVTPNLFLCSWYVNDDVMLHVHSTACYKERIRLCSSAPFCVPESRSLCCGLGLFQSLKPAECQPFSHSETSLRRKAASNFRLNPCALLLTQPIKNCPLSRKKIPLTPIEVRLIVSLLCAFLF